MKFKHLLLYSFFAFVIVSCSKNGGDNFTFTAPAVDTTGSSTATAPVTIAAGADAPPPNGDDSNNLFGNPTAAGTDIMANKDDYLINQGYYIESYNSTKQEPNWVCWHLGAANLGSTGRTDAFAAFGGLPPGFFAVQSDSYDAADFGFDRGHNCPSADRTSSTAANKSTFLMTNMIPQAPNNNQQTWGNLEDYLRSLVTAGNEVYIMMGSYGSGGTGSKGAFTAIKFNAAQLATAKYANYTLENINVPAYVWKVAIVLPASTGDLARVTDQTRIIAVNTPNINSINTNWKQYITTVNAIEAASAADPTSTAGNKINLLQAITSSTVRAALKAKVDPGS